MKYLLLLCAISVLCQQPWPPIPTTKPTFENPTPTPNPVSNPTPNPVSNPTPNPTPTQSPNPIPTLLDCGPNAHQPKINDTICICTTGYATYGPPCEYKQCNPYTALFLSLFLGLFGADYFYLARGNISYYLLGTVKAALFLSNVAMYKVIGIFFPQVMTNLIFRYTILIIALVCIAWWIALWILIPLGMLLDGNGIALG